jgi:sulfite exporter TauE/SafE
MEPLWGLIPCSFVYFHCTQSRWHRLLDSSLSSKAMEPRK